MTSSLQHYRVLGGDRSIASFRALYYRSNARLTYQRDLPYPYFGSW